MIEHFMCALFAHQFAPLIRTRRAEHAQSVGARQLQRGRAHTAARAMNENGFARLRFRSLNHPAIRRRVRRAHRRALRERNIGRQWMHLLRACREHTRRSCPLIDPAM